ncbi:methionyl-tRNA formyltransferase [Oleiagrimonas sp. MCCC 1A03011]|uniref:methionyl-tRNA formyltransferase n=1 Tax=Oleiagrimonas sp. MCCC 1A03011 TaxID=1926883 RepID=UPI00197EF0EF|nr:methionyl-tRNA formyltransferase [Oleiagrimonas sp. MCCC 1A03011]
MPRPLRLVFAGTPDFALPCLRACHDSDTELVAVYTQPDRPAGRGRKLTPSPIKQAALDYGVPVEQPKTLRDADAQAHLAAYRPDLMIVVAYGLILPQTVLDIPTLGCWNVHASLLPRWRGAAPIQRAIAAGDTETGVALMRMEAGLDTGPVLLERRQPIAPDETGGSLHDKLAALGAEVLADGLRRALDDDLPQARPQPDEGVTYAHKLDKAEAELDFSRCAVELERKVRAFDPWPVAVAEVAGERLRLWSAKALDRDHDAAPGTVLGGDADGLDIACGENVLRVDEVQRAGGRRMRVADFLNARPDLRRRGA